MSDLLEKLATYLANKMDLVLGENAFYFEMPDTPDVCLCVQEEKYNKSTPAQIDAVERKVVITVRAKSNTEANELAELAYKEDTPFGDTFMSKKTDKTGGYYYDNTPGTDGQYHRNDRFTDSLCRSSRFAVHTGAEKIPGQLAGASGGSADLYGGRHDAGTDFA